MVGARKGKIKDFEPCVATSWVSCDESQAKPAGEKTEIEIKPNSDKKASGGGWIFR